MSRKKKLIAVVVLLALGVAAGWWFNVPAKLGWTRRHEKHLTLYGNVDIRQVQLGFRVSGRIEACLVDEGDEVKAGQLISRLDAKPYEDQMRSAVGQVSAQKATLDKLVAGPRKAEIDQARAALAERVAERSNAELTFHRNAQLQASDSVSHAALDDAQASHDMAVARVNSAREALRLLEQGSRAEDIAAARATLQTAEANLSSTQISVADTRLVAPTDGVILSRVREPGAIVSPNDIVFVLSVKQPMWVRAYVAEPNLGKIHPGMSVDVITDSAPDHPYKGQIGFVSPVAEFTPKSVETPELRTDLVYRLRVVIENADDGLRQGMPVTVRIPMPNSD
ncbi:MAG: secretion protein HlyD [Polyangiaceae bacterium]|nr:secretion protein HlyD [Polyangiaceae bacterium]